MLFTHFGRSKILILILLLFALSIICMTVVAKNFISAFSFSLIRSNNSAIGQFVFEHIQDNVLFVTTVNLGYLDMFRNMLKSLKNVSESLQSRLCFIYEGDNMRLLYQNYSEFINRRIPFDLPKGLSNNVQNFNSAGFNAIVCKRAEMYLQLLELGVDVLHVDSDIAFLRDPFPLFNHIINTFQGVDIIVTSDECKAIKNFNSSLINTSITCGVHANCCAGIVYLRAKRATKTFLNKQIQKMKNGCDGTDQKYFNEIIEEMTLNHSLNVHVLPPALFPNGCDYERRLNLFNKSNVVMVHSNYRVGKKAKENFLKVNGLWFLK